MPTTDELLQYRNTLRDQANSVKNPVTADEAARYLNANIGNFEPLQNERRSIMAQSAQVLPSQIGQYLQAKQAGQPGASAINQLQSIMGNQANLRSTADLLGDQIQTGRGSISNIANSTMQMLGQKQSQLSDLLNLANSDYNTQAQRDFQAQQAQIDRDFQAQQAALSRRGSGGGYASMLGGGGQNPQTESQGQEYVVDIEQQKQEPDFWGNLAKLPSQASNAWGNTLINLFKPRGGGGRW